MGRTRDGVCHPVSDLQGLHDWPPWLRLPQSWWGLGINGTRPTYLRAGRRLPRPLTTTTPPHKELAEPLGAQPMAMTLEDADDDGYATK